MAESGKVISAEELERMTAAERAAVLSEALVTDLDSLDDHRSAVVARGRKKVFGRLQRQS